jgi:hypothetical protein
MDEIVIVDLFLDEIVIVDLFMDEIVIVDLFLDEIVLVDLFLDEIVLVDLFLDEKRLYWIVIRICCAQLKFLLLSFHPNPQTSQYRNYRP